MELSRGVLVTGADGQLGAALCEVFGDETRVTPLLRSEHPDAPALPHWREGLRACLERLSA